MNFNNIILAVNFTILGYFVLMNGFYLLLYVVSFVEITDHARREIFAGLSELLASSSRGCTGSFVNKNAATE